MSKRRLSWLALAVAVAIAYPWVLHTPFEQRLGALVILYAIAGSAWNILGGYAGQISFGHAIFFGCGAYSALAVFQHYGWPPLVGLPIGIGVSLLIALVIGIPTLRLSGHYFSMATIAVAELIRLLVVNNDYLGAATGMSGPVRPRTVFDLSFISALPYYYIFLFVLAVTLAITWWIRRNRIGYYLRAIKESERGARSLGVAARRYKFFALCLSAALTSVAGTLFACMVGFINPGSGFSILLSVQMVIIAALGGVDWLLGPLVGAIILIPVGQLSNNLLGGNGNGLTFLVYGAVILLISRFQPGGILPLLARLFKRKPGTRMQPTSAP